MFLGAENKKGADRMVCPTGISGGKCMERRFSFFHSQEVSLSWMGFLDFRYSQKGHFPYT